MAFKSLSISDHNFKSEMSLEEFKRWLRTFDTNNDGRMSKEELREAIRVTGGWFSGWKSSNAVRTADTNGNGFVDENEIKNLVHFAEKNLSVKIVGF